MFFIAVSKDLRAAAIAAAALRNGMPHVELADYADGAAWLSGRVRELHERYPGTRFGAYSAGPVKSWAPTFAEFGVELELLNGTEAISACSHLQRLADQLAFTHYPDAAVVESLKGAEQRETEGGGWMWDWRNSAGDLAPVAAVTGALWLLEKHPAYDLLQSIA
jgi:hypothetical protein